MATLGTMRTAVFSAIGMDSTASGADETSVTKWLNEGVREVLLRTHCRIEVTDMTLTADEWKYDLPTGIMAIKHITDSANNPVDVVQFGEIQELRRADSSTAVSGTLRVAFLGSNLFTVWPTPSAADSLEFFYVPKPTEMSSSVHDPSESTYGGVPTEFHSAIELWALYRASDHEHEGRSDQGIKYLAQFDEYLRRVVKPAVIRMAPKMGRVRVGRRPMISSDNGRYPRY
jgi:hypothetical protein